MARYAMTENAVAMVRGWNPRQTCMFVMSSRSRDAVVREVHISVDAAKRAARMIDSCVRVGRVVDGSAETM